VKRIGVRFALKHDFRKTRIHFSNHNLSRNVLFTTLEIQSASPKLPHILIFRTKRTRRRSHARAIAAKGTLNRVARWPSGDF
jgi:hypothetical protein